MSLRNLALFLLVLVIVGVTFYGLFNLEKLATLKNNLLGLAISSGVEALTYEEATAYKFATLPTKRGEAYFDAPILPFDEKSAREAMGEAGQFVDFGSIRDAWGYPESTMEKRNQEISTKETRKLQNQDDDTGLPGFVNCRENENVTGYFTAYFKDVDLNSNTGYDDPTVNTNPNSPTYGKTYGQIRRDKACQVLKDIASLIKLDEMDITPDIYFNKTPYNMPTNALAAASAFFGYYTVGPDNGSLHKHIISGSDPNSWLWSFDATVITNFSPYVYWDDVFLTSNNYHLYTVLYHEILHALGFVSRLPEDVTITNVQVPYTTYSLFNFEDATLLEQFINPITELLQVPIGNPPVWFTNNSVVYRGRKNITNSTPDGIRPVFTPPEWEDGSSLSHFDMVRAPGHIYLMHPYIGTNTIRYVHEHEKEVLCHLGYQVSNLYGCALPTPVALDDVVLLDDVNSSCITPLVNDISTGGGVLSMYNLITVSLEPGDQLKYYLNDNCTGLLPNATHAKSIKIISGGSAEPRVLIYKNKDSITKRISFPANILIYGCQNEAGDYVCNGDFEMEPQQNMSAFYCGSEWTYFSKVPWWCQFSGTPDLAEQGINTTIPPINLPYFCPEYFPNCEIDSLDEGKRLAHLWKRKIASTGESTEGLVTVLEQSLVAGEEYVLSLDYKVVGLPMETKPVSIMASLNHVPILSDNEVTIFIPVYEQTILNHNDYSNTNQWVHVEKKFIPDENFSVLAVYNNFPESTEIVDQVARFYFDNISIRSTDRGKIKIIKNVKPGYDSQDFSFVTDSGFNFKLDDDIDPTLSNTIEFDVPIGNHTVTEYLPAGLPGESYYLESITCNDPSGGTTVNVGQGKAFINVATDETVTCTFINRKENVWSLCDPTEGEQCGTIRITKNTIPDAYQDFTFQNNFAPTFLLDDDATLPNPSTLSHSKSFSVPFNGSFYVKEVPVSGYKTIVSCTDPTNDTTVSNLPTGSSASIKMSNGETISCWFNNTKIY